MWAYQKKLEYPVKIANPNPAYARIIISQLGGPDGEMGAATRYLSQRYAQPYKECKAMLTDIGISVSKLHIWISQLKLCHFDLEKVQLTRRFIPQSYTKRHIIEVNINHTIVINYGFL